MERLWCKLAACNEKVNTNRAEILVEIFYLSENFSVYRILLFNHMKLFHVSQDVLLNNKAEALTVPESVHEPLLSSCNVFRSNFGLISY